MVILVLFLLYINAFIDWLRDNYLSKLSFFIYITQIIPSFQTWLCGCESKEKDWHPLWYFS